MIYKIVPRYLISCEDLIIVQERKKYFDKKEFILIFNNLKTKNFGSYVTSHIIL